MIKIIYMLFILHISVMFEQRTEQKKKPSNKKATHIERGRERETHREKKTLQSSKGNHRYFQSHFQLLYFQ